MHTNRDANQAQTAQAAQTATHDLRPDREEIEATLAAEKAEPDMPIEDLRNLAKTADSIGAPDLAQQIREYATQETRTYLTGEIQFGTERGDRDYLQWLAKEAEEAEQEDLAKQAREAANRI